MVEPTGWGPVDPPDHGPGPAPDPAATSWAAPTSDPGASPSPFGPGYLPAPGNAQPPGHDPSYGPPPTGPSSYGPPPTGPSPYGPAGYGPAAAGAPGWGGAAAARRPGIVPLRPLSIGEILDGAFQAIRTNPLTMVGVSAIVLAIASVLSIVPEAALQQLMGDGLARARESQDPTAVLVPAALVSVSSVPGVLIVGLTTIVLNAMLVVAVSSAVLGRRTAPGELWRQVRRRVPAAIGLSLLSSLIVLLATALPLVPAVLAFVAGQNVAGVVLLLLGLLGSLLTAIWLSVRFALAAPALLLEQLGVVAALRRSWRLIRGSFWRVLLIEFIGYLLVFVGSSIISAPIGLVASLVQFATGNQDYTSFWGNLAVSGITAVGQIISGAIFNPWLSAVVALVYVDVRMRREGLDLELLRVAEAGTDS